MTGVPDTRQACDQVRRRHANYRRRQSAETVSMPAKVRESRLFATATRSAEKLGDAVDHRSAGMHRSLPVNFPSPAEFAEAVRYLQEHRGRGRSDFTRLATYPKALAARAVNPADLEPLVVDVAEEYRTVVKDTRRSPRREADLRRNRARRDLDRTLAGLVCLSLSVYGPVEARGYNRVWAAVALDIIRA